MGLGGLAADKIRAATASVSATVIAPARVITSWTDLPVMVIRSGNWIRVAMSLAQPPLSVSNPLNEADLVVGLPSSGNGTPEGTVNGEFATSLSKLAPSDDGSYRVTVAFN